MTSCHICVQNAADTIPIIVRRAPAIAVTLHPTTFITSVSIGTGKEMSANKKCQRIDFIYKVERNVVFKLHCRGNVVPPPPKIEMITCKSR